MNSWLQSGGPIRLSEQWFVLQKYMGSNSPHSGEWFCAILSGIDSCAQNASAVTAVQILMAIVV